jgi:flavin reductase (DIM6/NTAB) family NADH-FMN oxidoreductase RutF
MMREAIRAFDYAERILKALPEGILLNTMDEKFNSMVIGWGQMGILWGQPTFTVYVRQSRYTKPALDRTREFTVSVPLEGELSREVFRICGRQSGRETDKAKAAGLTLAGAEKINTPGIKEAPLTLECRVLYQQDQVLEYLPEELRERMYGREGNAGDFHTTYVGQIVSAYIIRE